MKTLETDFGNVIIDDLEGLCGILLQKLSEISAYALDRPAVVGLTGGSTPKAFYQWVTAKRPYARENLEDLIWTVSDERCVPHDDPESNWGNAWRQWLKPMQTPLERCLPWPTQLPPAEAAEAYQKLLGAMAQENLAYNVCMLGMGTDFHTASLFPECPLLEDDGGKPFAALNWPGKGPRLTITPTGIRSCAEIWVLVTGEAKKHVLHEALFGTLDPLSRPIQLLREHASRTTWFVDLPAAMAL